MIEMPERKPIISGIGISQIGRRTGIPGLELTREAAMHAISDAGLTHADIDGIATMGETPIPDVLADLELEVGYRGGGIDTGGLLSPLMSACLAVANGQARHVLVYRTVLMLGGAVLERSGDDPVRGMDQMPTLVTYHAYSAVNWLAMHAMRHMHLYGTTREQLGALAVNSRHNASLNPRAVYHEPITLDDYLGARMISDPLGLLDCDVPIDGSIAVVISAADHAADCPNSPVRIEAMGGSTGQGGWDQRPDYPNMASVDAAAEMWAGTDLVPSDVDVAQLYDGFTYLTLAWLEALGFCKTGEGGPFMEGGERISIHGELPLNTYGGQLSAGRMHGYWTIYEAVIQLRGHGHARQVDGAEVAVAAVGGGPIAGCLLLTR